jgi:hypothetical protein
MTLPRGQRGYSNGPCVAVPWPPIAAAFVRPVQIAVAVNIRQIAYQLAALLSSCFPYWLRKASTAWAKKMLALDRAMIAIAKLNMDDPQKGYAKITR